jgi:hypothetical protein
MPELIVMDFAGAIGMFVRRGLIIGNPESRRPGAGEVSGRVSKSSPGDMRLEQTGMEEAQAVLEGERESDLGEQWEWDDLEVGEWWA